MTTNRSRCAMADAARGLRGDADFDQSLSAMGVECHERTRVLATVCVPARLLIAGLVAQYGDRTQVRLAVAAGAAFAIFKMSGGVDDGQFWNRRLHIIVAVALLFSVFAGADKTLLGAILAVEAMLGAFSAVRLLSARDAVSE